MHANELLNNPELEPVIAMIDNYFQGMYHGDQERLRIAFHANAKLYGYRDGAFIELGLDEWLDRISTRPIPAKNDEPFEMTIDTNDMTGKVGSVKARDLYMGLRFTDYLNIAKVEGCWQILNKTFHHD